MLIVLWLRRSTFLFLGEFVKGFRDERLFENDLERKKFLSMFMGYKCGKILLGGEFK